jgi:hypothetical protein
MRSISKRFKNSRFAQWFKQTFKKQPDLTPGEIFALILLLLLVVAWAGPAAAVKGRKKK